MSGYGFAYFIWACYGPYAYRHTCVEIQWAFACLQFARNYSRPGMQPVEQKP